MLQILKSKATCGTDIVFGSGRIDLLIFAGNPEASNGSKLKFGFRDKDEGEEVSKIGKSEEESLI